MRARARLLLTAAAVALASCSSSNENSPNGGSSDVASGSSSASTAGSPSGASLGSAVSTSRSSTSDGTGSIASSGSHSGTSASAGSNSSGSTSTGACTVGSLPSGGTTHTGTNVNGTADGLGYGIWSNGSGGSITTFANATAFSASWNNGGDFLAHLGLDFNSSKSYTAYGTITAEFAESKTGTAGGYSSIGIYGWTQNPCVEWYIDDDSFNGLSTQKGAVTATIDGGTYSLTTSTTTGTGGNDCGGSVSSWTQMHSVRQTARQCGTITVSDHFAAWTAQGWKLGNLTSVHINVEVGGGNGSIQFPMANVTTTSN
jgi:endo-1,4-beta-xylanase